MFRRKPVPDLIRDGRRFADKNMRQEINMREPTSIHAVRRRAIRLWLIAVAALIFAMVLVGGATRLTESGLSITEWHPVSGTIPPLSEAAWNAEFAKYQATPQYRLVNRGITLAEFKTLLSTGVAIGGRKLGLMTEMSQAGLRYLRDDEVAELHAYLSAPEAAAHR